MKNCTRRANASTDRMNRQSQKKDGIEHERKYPLEARAKILTDDGRGYDAGVAFLYEDKNSLNGKIKALYRKIFSEAVYIVFDSMDATVICVDHIVAIRVEKDIPIV